VTVGIVDYGVGNLTSVWRALHSLGFRSRISDEPAVLDAVDLLLLPGVGAFPAAMDALHRRGLVDYLQAQGRLGRPMVGICLGMQLLAEVSHEHGVTAGLGLVPGKVVPLEGGRWHIGWNTLEVIDRSDMFAPSDGRSMYFNHSFACDVPAEYVAGVARLERPFPVMLRRGNIVGLQFHPEKSQAAGRQLVANVIAGLCGARRRAT
jgi:glutamine amidotransferase